MTNEWIFDLELWQLGVINGLIVGVPLVIWIVIKVNEQIRKFKDKNKD